MAYLLAVGHEPSDSIRENASAFIEQAEHGEGITRAEAWSRFCQALYATAEFRYVN